VDAAMEQIEWEDVQRIVLSGFKHLPRSAYILWRFQRETSARKKEWLAKLAKRLTRAVPDPSSKTSPAINLAFTASGLRHLGIAEPELNSFSLEFIEGMAPFPTMAQIPRRTNILGDFGASSPACWDWGGWDKNRDIDGLLLLFAADEKSLEELIEIERAELQRVAERDSVVLKAQLFPDMKEHFGYVDGLSQPKIEGRPKKWKTNAAFEKNKTSEIKSGSEVKPGEFLLGYLNERRERVTNGLGRDIRRNGTYLVFRQLEQDVGAFNAFVSDVAKRICENEEWVAARLLGRWRNGDPLVPKGPAAPAANSNGPDSRVADAKGPDAVAADAKESDAKAAHPKNDFLYYHEDRFGLTCPIGAHIRRANPRDSLGPDPDTALRLSKMHRIIRRGRPYGERWEPTAERPEGEKGERGIFFIALNADIAGQLYAAS
jgi:deferrochelatase/peroxidase EfeB